MAIDTQCPECGKQYRGVKSELAGKKAECVCGRVFVLGGANPNSLGDAEEANRDSISLSSAAVFENSYGDLDDILAGAGSATPLKPAAQTESLPRESPKRSRAAKRKSSAQVAQPSGRQSATATSSDPAYGSAGRSVGFWAAWLSGTIAAWSCWVIVSSRFSVLPQTPLATVSQALHDLSRGSFGSQSISASLQTTFVGLGWIIFATAAALLAVAVFQLLNALFKAVRRRGLIPGIDGVAAILASVLLFLIASSLFFHSDHMSQVTRELDAKLVGQADENTLLAQNVQLRREQNAAQSQTFITDIVTAAAAPLCVCILSLARVYVTLGEGQKLPDDPASA